MALNFLLGNNFFYLLFFQFPTNICILICFIFNILIINMIFVVFTDPPTVLKPAIIPDENNRSTSMMWTFITKLNGWWKGILYRKST